MQVEQTDNRGSVIWTIIKIIFALGIIYFGIMYFANKKSGDSGFVEPKPKKPKTKRKNKKV